MRKFIYTMLLAVIGSTWAIGTASCLHSETDVTGTEITVSGGLYWAAYPCEDGEPCPNCLAIVLETGAKTYYLTAAFDSIETKLNKLMYASMDLTCDCPPQVTVNGLLYTRGSNEYIYVWYIEVNSLRLPSLCDTWNVMVVDNVTCGGCEEYHTYRHYLTTDTIIEERRYKKLLVEGKYEGALREGDSKNIYCVPAGTTHEYLLYAFNAKVGDKLENVWLGGSPAGSPDGYVLTVDSVSETTPRIYSLHAEIKYGDEETDTWYVWWVEGVGLSDGPIGTKRCLGCADSRGYAVLCAYKEGAQVYASELSNEFGCYYDSTEQPADTIPLYAKVGDGPGSSTVDPVDPNQIVATLKLDNLIIREYINKDITYTLSKVPATNQAPARRRVKQTDSFRESVTVQLTESGTYELELTNPEWNYSIVGTFVYMPAGVEGTSATTAPAQKVLIDGRLLIKHGDKLYTLTGMQVE